MSTYPFLGQQIQGNRVFLIGDIPIPRQFLIAGDLAGLEQKLVIPGDLFEVVALEIGLAGELAQFE